MATEPNAAQINSTHPDEEVWTAAAERRYDNGEINADEARLASGLLPVAHETGTVAADHVAQLTLVTEDHVPLPGAKREPKLRKPPEARTASEQRAADQPPAHQRVTPFGHDPILIVHQGKQTDL